MRIIAGDAKGRRILSPFGKETRPTSDRVKEAIFNMLGEKVVDAKVLDLFGGTGNLGLEAISRGAESCVFIDSSRESIKVIHENIRLLKYEDYSEVYTNDAFTAIGILHKRGMNFDVIFLDPPYHKGIIPLCLNKILEADILNTDGVIICEYDIKDEIPDKIFNLLRFKQSTYGNTGVSFFKIMEE